MQSAIAPRHLLRSMFDAAVASAQPALRLRDVLPQRPRGRVLVVGAGKASAAMARALEAHWQGPLSGLVVTRYGHAVPCERIEIVEAAHPVPDEAGERAARRMVEMVKGLTGDDLVIGLFSGGGSALLPVPLEGLTLADEKSLNRQLLDSGASISEMNCLRRHLSAVKGGRLALACHPARVLNLLLSDVPGDDPIDIASGPTVSDPTSCQDAIEVARRYGIELPPAARAALEDGSGETPKPGDPRLPSIETRFIATPQLALEAAASVADAAGVPVHILGDAIEGEAREVGKVLAAIARQVSRRGQPFAAPCVLLSGGETTVTRRGDGHGGRNVELLLSMAIALEGCERVHALACDTDGIDGQAAVAGAHISPSSLRRARAKGISPRAALDRNDAHGFFAVLDDAIVSGPTLTNVNDFRAIYIGDPKHPSIHPHQETT